ncbi:hypothetical protein CP8484711_1818B, partial [Chlamydia psittaci 84-8471/1]
YLLYKRIKKLDYYLTIVILVYYKNNLTIKLI